MSANSTITVRIPGHGEYTAPTICVDAMIQRHLPASPEQLRAIVQERSGLDIGFTDVHDVSTFLVILADFYNGELAQWAEGFGS